MWSAQPRSQSVSLGATLVFRATASSSTPVQYRWQFQGEEIAHATNGTFTIAHIQLANAGDYAAVAMSESGSVTSRVANLDVDPAFIKITDGPIVNDLGGFSAGAWRDYDNNGTLDVFVSSLGGRPAFYRNDGHAGFTRLLTLPFVTNTVNSFASSWVDYDNDGWADLFVLNEGQRHLLFHNEGSNIFSRVTTGPLVNDIASSVAFAWGDYDNDGNIDLFVANRNGQRNALYHNEGQGKFARVTQGPIALDAGSEGCAWVDYDNDGYLDLFAVNFGQKSYLYHNEGGRRFTKITSGSIVNDAGGITCAWGDYDNDGFLDLFIADFGTDRLYHNEGNGTFRRVTSGALVSAGGNSVGCSWGDFNNDGYLDLFVSNWQNENNFLFCNNGNGGFERVLTGSPVNDGGHSYGCAWIDFDGDGALDLFVANRDQRNFLYRNNLTTNHWLRVRCIGSASNRDGIGAKVWVRAMIRGTNMVQVRQIVGSDGENNGHSSLAEFGLGDATRIEEVRVEWPSGTVQVLANVRINELMTIVEPPRIQLASQGADRLYSFTVPGTRNRVVEVQFSDEMRHWSPLLILTNQTDTFEFVERDPIPASARFYRVLVR